MLAKTPTEPFSRWMIFVILLAIWACIFLPDLGTLEIKGEEGRRIMPAVSMLETGNWIVPHLAGEGYYKKPPLINWLVAGSFSLLHTHSELAARLPSVISVLLFIAVIIFVGTPWLSLFGRFLTAIIFITNVSLLEKGRLIEIDATYTCLAGVAIILWLNYFSLNSKWKTWLVPSVVLGFGMLLKGPIILLFFYCPVILAVKRSRQKLLSVPHIFGIAIWLGTFLTWALMARNMGSGSEMTTRWWTELSARVIPPDFKLGDYLENIFKSLRNFSPWIVLVPLMWNRRWTSQIPEQWQSLYVACRRSVVIVFIFVTLLPGTLPRYSMPAFPLLSILLAWILSVNDWSPIAHKRTKAVLLTGIAITSLAAIVGMFVMHASILKMLYLAMVAAVTILVICRHHIISNRWPLAIAAGWFGCTAIAAYIAIAVPVAQKREKFRPMAGLVNSNIPPPAVIHVCQSSYNPMLFYFRPPVKYVDTNSLSPDPLFLFGEKPVLDQFLTNSTAQTRSPRSVVQFKDRGNRQFEVIELGAR